MITVAVTTVIVWYTIIRYQNVLRFDIDLHMYINMMF